MQPEGDSSALSPVWEKVIREQMLCGICGHLMWSKLSNTNAEGFGKPKTARKLKHRKAKVCS